MPALEKEMAESLSLVLLSNAAHGFGTETLSGLGEITLRDGLVAGAASIGARRNAAWIIEREHKPQDWNSGNIDLTVWRKRRRQKEWFCSAELKWWHRNDTSNASNRRADLIRDFIRAGSVYPRLLQPDKMSFVLLLSTQASWGTTVERHEAGDHALCTHWKRAYATQSWDLKALKVCPGLRTAVKELRQMGVKIPNIIHSDLTYSVSIRQQRSQRGEVRCWSVRKPQNSTFLDDGELDEILGG